MVGDAPVFDPLAMTNYGFMLPGAGVVTADTAHAWVIGFGEQRGNQELLHMTSSTGGIDWVVADSRVEDDIEVALNPPGPIPSTVLAPDADGEWVMYISGSPEAGVTDGADIWRATAPAPEGPWTADPEPVLARRDVPTETGAAPLQLDFPAVVRTDDGYLMLFGWSPSGSTTLIRSATSVDGITWTVAEDPAIDLGLCGEFDSRSVAMPRLAAQPGGGWLALYGAFGAVLDDSMVLGMARSSDGDTWSCAASEPILEVEDIPRSERMHSYALLASDDAPMRLLVESLVDDRSVLWLAEVRTD
jgi:dipeptidyl aminopeptidase/acylaminoacyl peptidase